MSNSSKLVVDPTQSYPLRYSWSLSFKGKAAYKKQQSENDWLSTYEDIFKIESVKTFWEVFNNIHSWSDLHVGSIYALFKDDIKPSWEDPRNIKGCSYIFYLNRNNINSDSMNEMFLNVLMFMIGNETEYHDYLNGASFERKFKGDKITIWCTAQSDEMLSLILKHIDVRDTEYTRSAAPSNENYKMVVKIIDHQDELRKIAEAANEYNK